MPKFDDELTNNKRLVENRQVYEAFSKLDPVQSSSDMNAHFTIIERFSSGDCERARVYLAQKSSGEKCVLKLQSLDASESRYVTRAFRKNSRRGLQGNHTFLRYSSWTELNMLRNARQVLLQQASPCFPFLYSSHFVETIDNIAFPLLDDVKERVYEPQLVHCIEYLSRITLRKWLHNQIISSRYWQQEMKNAVELLKQQFSILFFHIFAALYTLHNVGEFQHNDLHLDNILMVHSKEVCGKFVYIINGKSYVIPNILGDFLRQIPIICDFETASSVEEMQNISFQEHFRQTHKCAFHRCRLADEKCNHTVFCDILRILQDTFDELHSQENSKALEQAFRPFNTVREQLLQQFETHCSNELLCISALIESLYIQSSVPSSDFLLFDCDKIVPNK